MVSFQSKIANGILWNTLQMFFSKGLSYLVLLALARILTKEAFGLIGMATVFTGLIAVLGNAGITAALVQIHQDKLTSKHFTTAWQLSLFFNAALWLIFATLIAPFASWFYSEPALRGIIAVIAAQALIASANVVPRARLTRDLNFKRIAWCDSLSTAAAAALALAFSGFGVWSLVIQVLAMECILIPLLWSASKWKPIWHWSSSAFKDLWEYGFFDSLNRGFIYFSKNIDYLLIGKLLGAEILGVYTMAFLVTDILRAQIMSVLNKVMFPIYGKLQNDRASVKAYYLKVIRYNTCFVAPPMLVFILLAKAWVPIIFGDQWNAAIFPIQAMAIGGIIHSIGGTTDSVLKALGEVQLVFKIYLWKTLLVTVPAFCIGIYFFGINGAAVAIIIHKLAGRSIYQYFMAQQLNVTNMEVLKSVRPGINGLIAGSITYLYLSPLLQTNQLTHLCALTISLGLASLIFSVFPLRHEIRGWLQPAPT